MSVRCTFGFFLPILFYQNIGALHLCCLNIWIIIPTFWQIKFKHKNISQERSSDILVTMIKTQKVTLKTGLKK